MENITYTETPTTATVIDPELVSSVCVCYGEAVDRLIIVVQPVLTTTVNPGDTVKFALTYEAIHDDVERFIASVAQTYTDQSCPQLHHDEIVAECRAKTAKLVNDGWLEKVKSRKEFFKVFATSIKHHVCSLVLKFRYTEKRTGVKPPPRRKRTDILNGTADQHEHRKNVEVSLDDEEAGVQVAATAQPDEGDVQELMQEFRTLLTVTEQNVFHQMIEPNLCSLLYAQLDAYRGKTKSPVRVKIKHEHLAAGIDLPLEVFEDRVLKIREKIKVYRAMNDQQQESKGRFNATVQVLCEIFQVQIPKSHYVDDMLVRRLFTIAARTEYQKVNADVAGMLSEIGAMVPEVSGTLINCHGVLYNRNDHLCNSCGVRLSCATKAASFGLDTMNPSPKLLGSRLTRIPVIVPQLTDSSDPLAGAVMDYINETFTKFEDDGTYFGQKGASLSSLKRFFQLESETPFRLRFCKPSDSMKQALYRQGKNYYLPDAVSVDDAVKLIEQHVKEIVWQTIPQTTATT